MKRYLRILTLVLLIVPLQTGAQQTEREKQLMEAWSKLAVPGEHHQHIAQFQGNWDVVVKVQTSATGTLQESSGSCEKKVVLGNRYLSEHCTTRTKTGNQTSEGFGYLGYDNFKKSYVSLWMSTDSTMINPLYGSCDGKGKVITVAGNYTDPVSGRERQSRWIWTVIDPNKHTVKIESVDPEGKDSRSAQATYTRKK